MYLCCNTHMREEANADCRRRRRRKKRSCGRREGWARQLREQSGAWHAWANEWSICSPSRPPAITKPDSRIRCLRLRVPASYVAWWAGAPCFVLPFFRAWLRNENPHCCSYLDDLTRAKQSNRWRTFTVAAVPGMSVIPQIWVWRLAREAHVCTVCMIWHLHWAEVMSTCGTFSFP